MSGVLNRMVQRSRGQLPAIEPLVRSQQTAAAALPLVMEESVAASSRGRNAAMRGAERASREESAGPMQARVSRDAAQASVPDPKDSRRFEPHEVAPVKRVAESDGAPAAKVSDLEGWNGERLEQLGDRRDVVQANKEPHPLPFEMLQEKMPAGSDEAIGGSIRPAPKVVPRAATPDIPVARNGAEAPASTIDEPEQTEIHITIGSVELRAPRVASVAPKAPPFKPRVTLDEFLKRGSGTGGRGARS